jgi:hypothetical protein
VSTPALSTLKRTTTGIISNRRPAIGVSATPTPADEPPQAAAPTSFNLLAAAKRAAARQHLYAFFYRGPVLGPDAEAVVPSVSAKTTGMMVEPPVAPSSAAAVKEKKKRKSIDDAVCSSGALGTFSADPTHNPEEAAKREAKRLRKAARAARRAEKDARRQRREARIAAIASTAPASASSSIVVQALAKRASTPEKAQERPKKRRKKTGTEASLDSAVPCSSTDGLSINATSKSSDQAEAAAMTSSTSLVAQTLTPPQLTSGGSTSATVRLPLEKKAKRKDRGFKKT